MFTGFCEESVVEIIAWRVMRWKHMHPLAALVSRHRNDVDEQFHAQASYCGLRVRVDDDHMWIADALSTRWLRPDAQPLSMYPCRMRPFIMDKMTGSQFWFQQYNIRFYFMYRADCGRNSSDCEHQNHNINFLCSHCQTALCEVCMAHARYSHFCMCTGAPQFAPSQM